MIDLVLPARLKFSSWQKAIDVRGRLMREGLSADLSVIGNSWVLKIF